MTGCAEQALNEPAEQPIPEVVAKVNGSKAPKPAAKPAKKVWTPDRIAARNAQLAAARAKFSEAAASRKAAGGRATPGATREERIAKLVSQFSGLGFTFTGSAEKGWKVMPSK